MVKIPGDANKALSFKILEYDVLDSTNDECKRLISENKSDKYLVIAKEQTSGRGRYERNWSSPPNAGLYASWILQELNVRLELVPIYAAYCVASRLTNLLSREIKVKWPNDIYINNKKIGGVLVEKHKDIYIVGVGLNLCRSDAFPPAAISLEEIDFNVDLNEAKEKVITVISRAFEEPLPFKTDDEFIEEVNNYFLFPKGSKITYLKDEVIFKGTVSDIGKNFELIVELENGKMVTLRAGEITIKV